MSLSSAGLIRAAIQMLHGALAVVLAAGLSLSSASGAEDGGGDSDSCQSFEDTIARAAAQWPRSSHYALVDQIGRSFVTGYNRVRTGGEELVADEVWIFPMPDHDTWFALAGHEGCFVFWTELAPDLMQKLMANGPRGPVDLRDEEF